LVEKCLGGELWEGGRKKTREGGKCVLLYSLERSSLSLVSLPSPSTSHSRLPTSVSSPGPLDAKEPRHWIRVHHAGLPQQMKDKGILVPGWGNPNSDPQKRAVIEVRREGYRGEDGEEVSWDVASKIWPKSHLIRHYTHSSSPLIRLFTGAWVGY